MIGNWTLHYSKSPQAIAAVYAAVFLFILINNTLVLAAFYQLKKLKPLHHFMIGLAATDLVILVPYGISMVTVALGYIKLNYISCDAIAMIEMITKCATSWIHCSICIEKCAAVWVPVRHRSFSLSRRLHLITSGIVLFCFAIPASYYVVLLHNQVIRMEFNTLVDSCRVEMSDKAKLAISIPFFAIPLLIQVITNMAILQKMRSLSLSNKRAFKVIVITLCLHYICQIHPIIMMIWMKAAPYSSAESIMPTIGRHILVANCGMSGIIYFVTLPDFRKALQNGCNCSRSHNAGNHEKTISGCVCLALSIGPLFFVVVVFESNKKTRGRLTRLACAKI